MSSETKGIKVDAPQELVEYAKKLSDSMELARHREKTHPGSIRWLNHQYGNGLDDLLLSKGLGFDRGYTDCRERQILRWIEMALIHQMYLGYEHNLYAPKHKTIDRSEWNKDVIYALQIWDDYLKDMLKTTLVPDKEAFLQGWCDGGSKFFLSICQMIQCPSDFAPAPLPDALLNQD